MSNKIKTPSLDEFKNQCRKEFEFLINDFGFEEYEIPSNSTKNQFIIKFIRSDLNVIIEGVSYGSATYTYLENSTGRGILLEYLDSKFQPFVKKTTRGQIEDIKKQARFLRKYGLKLLHGDISIFEDAVKRVEAAMKEYKSHH
jgi:hypothetical protein